MDNNTSIWQIDGSVVYKLRETGKMRRINGALVPEVENELYMNVTRARDPKYPTDTDSKESAESVAARVAAYLNTSHRIATFGVADAGYDDIEEGEETASFDAAVIAPIAVPEIVLVMQVTAPSGKVIQVFKEQEKYRILADGVKVHADLTTEQVLTAIGIMVSPYYRS